MKTGGGRWMLLFCMIESLAHVGRNGEAGGLYPLVRTMLEYPNLLDRTPADELNALLPAGPAQEVVARLLGGSGHSPTRLGTTWMQSPRGSTTSLRPRTPVGRAS